MPTPKRGNPKSQSKDSKDWQSYDFVEIPLTEEQKADFKAMYAKDANALLGYIPELVGDGYKLSSTWDEPNKCFIVSLTCKDPLSTNFGYVMTSRAGDLWEAMSLALYKHRFACDDEDWGAETRTNGRSWG